jgi:hypothetical protein
VKGRERQSKIDKKYEERAGKRARVREKVNEG